MSKPIITEEHTKEHIVEHLMRGGTIYVEVGADALGEFSYDFGEHGYVYQFFGRCRKRGHSRFEHNGAHLAVVPGECEEWSSEPFRKVFRTLEELAFWYTFVGAEWV